jgi:Fe-S-cluster containining protein
LENWGTLHHDVLLGQIAHGNIAPYVSRRRDKKGDLMSTERTAPPASQAPVSGSSASGGSTSGGTGTLPAPRPVTPEDVERGLRFNHQVEHQTRQRLAELSASYYALLETLVARGVLPMAEHERRRQAALEQEQTRMRDEMAPLVSLHPDKYSITKLPEIDCGARMPLCRARCCTLVFPLSTQDLDERVLRWDYGKPYLIARRPDGYCVHNEAGTCRCTVYEQRPAVCRTYDCRGDRRIWIDFDKRIAAP